MGEVRFWAVSFFGGYDKQSLNTLVLAEEHIGGGAMEIELADQSSRRFHCEGEECVREVEGSELV